MSGANVQLSSQQTNQNELSIPFTIWTIVLSIFFLFYALFSARLFGLVVTFVAKFSLGKGTRLRIGSVSFAVIGGKILLKNIQYTSLSSSFQAADGIVSLQWFRKAPDPSPNPQFGTPRIRVSFSAVEYVLFNNKGKYDRLRQLLEKQKNKDLRLEVPAVDNAAYRPPGATWEANIPSWYKSMGGVDIVLEGFVLMVGNVALKTMSVIHSQSAQGVFRLDRARSQHDWYKNVLDLTLKKPSIYQIPNPDYVSGFGKTEWEKRKLLASGHSRHRVEDFLADTVKSFKTFFKDVRFAFFSQDDVSDYDDSEDDDNGVGDSDEDSGGRHGNGASGVATDRGHTRQRSNGGAVEPQAAAGSGRSNKRKPTKKKNKKGSVASNQRTDGDEIGSHLSSSQLQQQQHAHMSNAFEQYQKSLRGGSAKTDLSRVLLAEEMQVQYYFDSPGVFPDSVDPPVFDDDTACEQGVNINLKKANLTYGPWMDHQRDTLTKFLNPWDCQDIPLYTPRPGDVREYTKFDALVTFDDAGTLKIPYRRYAAYPQLAAKLESGQDQAGLTCDLAPGSTIGFAMSWMTPKPEGMCYTKMRFDLVDCLIRTSINDFQEFISTKKLSIIIDFPYPLQWNGLYYWTFQFDLGEAKLFWSSEHGNAINDLLWDWTTYEPEALRLPDNFVHFCPTIFRYRCLMGESQILIPANAFNVIENSKFTDLASNTYVVLSVPSFSAEMKQSWLVYNNSTTDMEFSVDCDSMNMHLNLPSSSAHLLDSESGPFLQISKVDVRGNYFYYNKVHHEYLDGCHVDLSLRSVRVRVLQPAMSALANMSDNLFGQSRFSMSPEQFRREKKNDLYANYLKSIDPTPHNGFEVFLTVEVARVQADFPRHLHGGPELAGRLQTTDLVVEMRTMPDYSDTVVNTSPITVVFPQNGADMEDRSGESGFYERSSSFASYRRPQDAAASRLSGDSGQNPIQRIFLGIDATMVHVHTLYSAPPTSTPYRTSTTACVGKVTGVLMPMHVRIVAEWLQNYLALSSLPPPSQYAADLYVGVDKLAMAEAHLDQAKKDSLFMSSLFAHNSVDVRVQLVSVSVAGGAEDVDDSLSLGAVASTLRYHLHLSLDRGLLFRSDTLATLRYQTKQTVRIPSVVASQLLLSNASAAAAGGPNIYNSGHHTSKNGDWTEVARVSTGIMLSIFGKRPVYAEHPAGFVTDQRTFLASCDSTAQLLTYLWGMSKADESLLRTMTADAPVSPPAYLAAEALSLGRGSSPSAATRGAAAGAGSRQAEPRSSRPSKPSANPQRAPAAAPSLNSSLAGSAMSKPRVAVEDSLADSDSSAEKSRDRRRQGARRSGTARRRRSSPDTSDEDAHTSSSFHTAGGSSEDEAENRTADDRHADDLFAGSRGSAWNRSRGDVYDDENGLGRAESDGADLESFADLEEQSAPVGGNDAGSADSDFGIDEDDSGEDDSDSLAVQGQNVLSYSEDASLGSFQHRYAASNGLFASSANALSLSSYDKLLSKYDISFEKGVLTPVSIFRRSKLGLRSPYPQTEVRERVCLARTAFEGSSFLAARDVFSSSSATMAGSTVGAGPSLSDAASLGAGTSGTGTDGHADDETGGVQGFDRLSDGVSAGAWHLPPFGFSAGMRTAGRARLDGRGKEIGAGRGRSTGLTADSGGSDDYFEGNSDDDGNVAGHLLEDATGCDRIVVVDFTRELAVIVSPAMLDSIRVIMQGIAYVVAANPASLVDRLERELLLSTSAATGMSSPRSAPSRSPSGNAATPTPSLPANPSARQMICVSVHTCSIRAVQSFRHSPLAASLAGTHGMSFAPKLAASTCLVELRATDVLLQTSSSVMYAEHHVGFRAIDLYLTEVKNAGHSRSAAFEKLPTRVRSVAALFGTSNQAIVFALTLSDGSVASCENGAQSLVSVADIACSLVDSASVLSVSLLQAWLECVSATAATFHESVHREHFGVLLLLNYLQNRVPDANAVFGPRSSLREKVKAVAHATSTGLGSEKDQSLLLQELKGTAGTASAALDDRIKTLTLSLRDGVRQIADLSFRAASAAPPMIGQAYSTAAPSDHKPKLDASDSRSRRDQKAPASLSFSSGASATLRQVRISLERFGIWVVDTSTPSSFLPPAEFLPKHRPSSSGIAHGSQPRASSGQGASFSWPTAQEMEETHRYTHGAEIGHVSIRTSQGATHTNSSTTVVGIGRIKGEAAPGVLHCAKYFIEAAERLGKGFAAAQPPPAASTSGALPPAPPVASAATSAASLQASSVHVNVHWLQLVVSCPGSGILDTTVRNMLVTCCGLPASGVPGSVARRISQSTVLLLSSVTSVNCSQMAVRFGANPLSEFVGPMLAAGDAGSDGHGVFEVDIKEFLLSQTDMKHCALPSLQKQGYSQLQPQPQPQQKLGMNSSTISSSSSASESSLAADVLTRTVTVSIGGVVGNFPQPVDRWSYFRHRLTVFQYVWTTAAAKCLGLSTATSAGQVRPLRHPRPHRPARPAGKDLPSSVGAKNAFSQSGVLSAASVGTTTLGTAGPSRKRRDSRADNAPLSSRQRPAAAAAAAGVDADRRLPPTSAGVAMNRRPSSAKPPPIFVEQASFVERDATEADMLSDVGDYPGSILEGRKISGIASASASKGGAKGSGGGGGSASLPGGTANNNNSSSNNNNNNNNNNNSASLNNPNSGTAANVRGSNAAANASPSVLSQSSTPQAKPLVRLHVSVDIQKISMSVSLLKTVDMTHAVSRLSLGYRISETRISHFSCHVFAHLLTFTTRYRELGRQSSVPGSFRRTKAQFLSSTRRSLPPSHVSKREFALPQIWATHDKDPTAVDPSDQSRFVQQHSDITVEYVENTVSVGVLSQLLELRRALAPDIHETGLVDSAAAAMSAGTVDVPFGYGAPSSIGDGNNSSFDGTVGDIDEELGGEGLDDGVGDSHPLSEDSEATGAAVLPVRRRLNVHLEGIHLTCLSSCTALVVDTGATSLSTLDDAWRLDVRDLSLMLIDPGKIVFSQERMMSSGRYSDISQCFLWADLRTHVSIRNFHDLVPLSRSSKNNRSEKIFATVYDTSLLVRPGAVGQIEYLYRHYNAAFEEFSEKINQEPQQDAEQRLVSSTQEYVAVLQRQVVLGAGSSGASGDDPHLAAAAAVMASRLFLLRVTNLWVCVPVGDTPYARVPRTVPAHAHFLVESIVCRAKQTAQTQMTVATANTSPIRGVLLESLQRLRPSASDIRRATCKVTIDGGASLNFHGGNAVSLCEVLVGAPIVEFDATAVPIVHDLAHDWTEHQFILPAAESSTAGLVAGLCERPGATLASSSSSLLVSGPGMSSLGTSAGLSSGAGAGTAKGGRSVTGGAHGLRDLSTMHVTFTLKPGRLTVRSAYTNVSKAAAAALRKTLLTTVSSSSSSSSSSSAAAATAASSAGSGGMQQQQGGGKNKPGSTTTDLLDISLPMVEASIRNSVVKADVILLDEVVEISPLALFFVDEAHSRMTAHLRGDTSTLSARGEVRMHRESLAWIKTDKAVRRIQAHWRGHVVRRLLRQHGFRRVQQAALRLPPQSTGGAVQEAAAGLAQGLAPAPSLSDQRQQQQLQQATSSKQTPTVVLVQIMPFKVVVVCTPVADSDAALEVLFADPVYITFVQSTVFLEPQIMTGGAASAAAAAAAGGSAAAAGGGSGVASFRQQLLNLHQPMQKPVFRTLSVELSSTVALRIGNAKLDEDECVSLALKSPTIFFCSVAGAVPSRRLAVNLDQMLCHFDLDRFSQYLILSRVWSAGASKVGLAKAATATAATTATATASSTMLPGGSATHTPADPRSAFSVPGQGPAPASHVGGGHHFAPLIPASSVILAVDEVLVNSSLGQIVGTQRIQITRIRGHVLDRGRSSPKMRGRMGAAAATFLVAQCRLDCQGRLAGHLSLSSSSTRSGLAVQLQRFYPTNLPPKRQLHKAINKMRAAVCGIEGQMEYSSLRFLSLDAREQVLRWRDKFEQPFDGSDWLSEIVVTSDRLALGLSGETSHVVAGIGKAVSHYMEEHEAEALSTLSRINRSFGLVILPAASALERQQQWLPLRPASVRSQLRSVVQSLTGVAMVLGRNINIQIFRRGIVDDDAHLAVNLANYRIVYAVGVNVPEATGEASAAAGVSPGAVSPATLQCEVLREVMVAMGDLNVVRETGASSSPIMRMKGAVLDMVSSQMLHSPRLSYRFTSKFKDKIYVSTNVPDYAFMREVVASLAGSGGSATADYGAMGAASVPGYGDTDPFVPMPSNSLSPLATAVPRQGLQYVCEKFELEPSISVLGNLTPKVETVLDWMGIQDHKNAIPRVTHENLSLMLEQMVSDVSQASRSLDVALDPELR